MKDGFCQILALDVDEEKSSTSNPLGQNRETHAYNLTLLPQFLVGTWKQERNAFPCLDVQAALGGRAGMTSVLHSAGETIHSSTFSLFLFCPISDICHHITEYVLEWHKMPFLVSSLVVKALFLQQKLLICSSLMLWGGLDEGLPPSPMPWCYYITMAALLPSSLLWKGMS